MEWSGNGIRTCTGTDTTMHAGTGGQGGESMHANAALSKKHGQDCKWTEHFV